MVNKYQKWYNSIIAKAKNRPNITGYYETHHIIPKCTGGSNNDDNLVKLTFREHFLAHALLCKIYKNTEHFRKLQYAFMCMFKQKNKFQQRIITNSRLYKKVKEQYCASTRGVKRSPEIIKKMKANRKYRTHTLEARANISKALKGKKKNNPHIYAQINRDKAEKQKLPPEACQRIRDLRNSGLKWREIAAMYNKSPNVIRNIVLRINGYQNR